MSHEHPRYIMVADFDGTAAARDIQQVILDALADREAWRVINRRWTAGEMTTAQRARAQWALLRGGEVEVRAVLENERLDPGFPAFATFCAERGYPLTIVSDGFDFYIEPLLAGAGLGDLPVVSNSLRYVQGVPEMRFLLQRSPDQYYGNDKTVVIEGLRTPGSTVVFFGDGYSDRDAARAADLLFAKDRLALYCQDEGIPYLPFATFFDVIEYFSAGA